MDRGSIAKRFADYVYYFKAYCTSDADDHEMLKAVLSMLKEQEPIKPIRASDEMECTWYYVCPKCKIAIDYKDKYCRHCGSEMNWDE